MNRIGHVDYSVVHGTHQKAIGEPLTRIQHKVISSGEGSGVQQVLVSSRSRLNPVVVPRPVSVIDVRDGLNMEVHPGERG